MKRSRFLESCIFGASVQVILAVGCARTPLPAASPPTAEKPKTESELARTTLSAKSVQSLGIRSAPLQTKKVQESLALTGWIMAKQGNEVTVTAPLAGYVRAPAANGGVPIAGVAVKAGQELFVLEPMLTPVEQIQMAALKRGIESEITKARENLGVAEKELQRVQDLVRQKVKTEQELEQANARHKNALEDLAAAEDKRKLFAATGDDKTGPQLHPLSIRAPRAGTVLSVPVSPGQYVAAAAPLVTIADLSEVWVRVPVPEFHLPRIDRTKAASIDRTAAAPLSVSPVSLVPQVDLTRRTAEMLYEIKPASGQGPFAKDQMVSVQVPLGVERQETVVPYSAIVFDSYARAWIYLHQAPQGSGEHVFERRRVEVGPRIGDDVVVRPAGKSGDRVVVAGAAQLFSREFYKPPVNASDPKEAVDDDD